MKKALVVGIDAYPDAPLMGCVNDAKSIANKLELNQDNSKNFDVRLELDISTKAKLLQAINELFSGDSEVALLYFSGHGSADGTGYLVTPDFSSPDWGVTMADVLQKANNSRCRNKVIILDSCYSGKLGENSASSDTTAQIAKGVTIMASSSRDEVSLESDGHGLFTSLLLQGMDGGAADLTGKITPAGLYTYIDQSLGAWQQRPVFKTNTSEFLPIRAVDPRVSMDTIRSLSNLFPEPNADFPLDPSFEDTNSPNDNHELIKPYADEKNIVVFKKLQALEGVGLIEPVDEEFMYFAAMHHKACRLTPLGVHYWKLSKDKRF